MKNLICSVLLTLVSFGCGPELDIPDCKYLQEGDSCRMYGMYHGFVSQENHTTIYCKDGIVQWMLVSAERRVESDGEIRFESDFITLDDPCLEDDTCWITSNLCR